MSNVCLVYHGALTMVKALLTLSALLAILSCGLLIADWDAMTDRVRVGFMAVILISSMTLFTGFYI